MTFGGRYAPALLFAGDIAVFVLSLWLALLVRYGSWPTSAIFIQHVRTFAFLFLVFALAFYIVGLYSKHVVLFKHDVPRMILGGQVVNLIIAALFFFLVPSVGIAPKTNLILYFCISLGLLYVWRLTLFPRLTRPASRERMALIASGPEAEELVREVNGNPRYYFEFSTVVRSEELGRDFNAFEQHLADASVTALVVDTENDALRPLLPRIYELAFVKRNYPVIDFYRVYEEVFDRVPLSLLQYDWFLKNVSNPASSAYRFAKRAIDIVGGLVFGVVTIVVTPFVFILMRLEGPGPVFIRQERIGMYGTRMTAYKFRSMRFSDSGKWQGEGENRVTRVGSFLRKTSLDEFPQFVNVLSGELSLIGPRNDIVDLGTRLAEAVPYYNIRYIVKPGITGWAQINQQYEPGNISPQSIEETKTRLAYDFYYIKNRALALDIVIALKTIKRMFFRVGTL